MPDLSFEIAGAKAVPFAVAPLLGFDLRLTNKGGETIHTVALRAQIQIEAPRRSYSPGDQESLRDLFGEPARWGQTLPHDVVDTCQLDHSRIRRRHSGRATRAVYLRFQYRRREVLSGLGKRRIPLCFQFSEIVFYQGQGGALQGDSHPLG